MKKRQSREAFFRRAGRSALSLGLSAVLGALSVFVPLGGMEAQAATELQTPTPALPLSGETANHSMTFSWKVGNDDRELTPALSSSRYNIRGKNADGSEPGITLDSDNGLEGNGIPLYIVMPDTDQGPAPYPKQTDTTTGSGGTGYWPGVAENDGRGNTYYIAKMGQRASELAGGNAASDANQNLSGAALVAKNGAVETTRFGPSGRYRTIETQVKTHVSGRYVIADYYFYGRENLPPGGQKFYAGMAYDLSVNEKLVTFPGYPGIYPSGEGQVKDMISTDRGFYARKSGDIATVNIVLDDATLGTSASSSKWMGKFDRRLQYAFHSGYDTETHGTYQFNPVAGAGALTGHALPNSDLSPAFSWELNLRPGETIHKRIAYSYVEAAIYISSSGVDTNSGTFDHPVNTFDKALQLAKNKNAVIYFEDDQALSAALTIDASKVGTMGSLTLASTDMHSNATSVSFGTETKTIAPAAGYSGPLFVNNQSTVPVAIEDLHFANGSGDFMLKNSSGTLSLGAGVVLENAAAGALSIEGGSVEFAANGEEGSRYPFTVRNNSAYQDTAVSPAASRGAVYLSAGGNLTVGGSVQISGNRNAVTATQPENLYLSNNKTVTVSSAHPLDSSSVIGFTTETLPTASTTVDVALNGADSIDRFVKDNTAIGIVKEKNGSTLRLKAVTHKVNRSVTDMSGIPIAGAPTLTPTGEDYMIGGKITVDGIPTTMQSFVAGGIRYVFDSVELSVSPGAALISPTDGKITDFVMPNDTVQVNYRYRDDMGRIIIDGNGGLPVTSSVNGMAGTQVAAILPSRYGYVVDKITENQDGTGAAITTNVAGQYMLVIANGVKTYYVQWKPDSSINYLLFAQYMNGDGSILFHQTPGTPITFSTVFTASNLRVPGYRLLPDKALSRVIPDSIRNIVGGVDTNWQINGNYSATMPNQDVALEFHYVPGNAESDKSNFTVEYRLGTAAVPGALVPGTAPMTTRYLPETQISQWLTLPVGYRINGTSPFRVVQGNQPSLPTATNNFVSAVRNVDITGNTLTAEMPNQDVKIEVYLEPDGTGVPFVTSFRDAGSQDSVLQVLRPTSIQNKPIGASFTEPFPEIYGYHYGATEPSWSDAPAGSGTVSVSGNAQSYAAIMPGGELDLNLVYRRDSAKWVKLNYLPGTHGTLSTLSAAADVKTDASGNYYAEVIRAGAAENEGYSFAEIKSKRLVPEVTVSESPYYEFAGWIINDNGNGALDAGEQLADDATKFSADTVLTAYYRENPAYWIDILLAPYDSNTLTVPGASLNRHVKKDSLFGSVRASAETSFTGIANYVREDWYGGSGAKIDATTVLQDGETYRLKYVKDPIVFGLPAQDVDAVGGLLSNNTGRVTVFDTKPGYNYILTDPAGTVLDVVPGSVVGRSYFDNRIPGEQLVVYEATGDVAVQPGDDIAVVTALNPPSPNAKIGAPHPVSIPLPNQNPDPEAVETPKFMIQTYEGDIDSVGTQAVNSDFYSEAHAGEQVTLTAPAVNAAGAVFREWRVTAGNIPNVSFPAGQGTVQFTMPETNLVLLAAYEALPGADAAVSDESRNAAKGEFSLVPSERARLSSLLTTPEDRVLSSVNGAKVEYRTVYTKKAVSQTASNALKAISVAGTQHPDAYRAAFELRTDIERYVDGRRVNATPSNATFDTYVQLENRDTDMLDYELFEEQPGGGYVGVAMQTLAGSVEENGGLFRFTAKAGVRYYLVYSKAYRLKFINEAPNAAQPSYSFKVRHGETAEDSYYAGGNARGGLVDPDPYAVDADGVEYELHAAPVWSKRADRYQGFDLGTPVRKRLTLYAYYENNRAELEDARKKLDEATRRAIQLADDYFLKRRETADLINGVHGVPGKPEIYGILESLGVLERTGPRASLAELQAALAAMEQTLAHYDNLLDPRYDNYGHQQRNQLSGGGSGGGGRGNGGSGRGAGRGVGVGSTAGGARLIPSDPFVADYEKGYTVGTNGNWELLNPEQSEWIFTLNGGMRLVNRWGKLSYRYGDRIETGWYHFGQHGIMDSGWFRDENMNWYYLDRTHDGFFGRMQLGWHHDEYDRRWYHFDENSGVMQTGWQEINGKWYYFATSASTDTYEYDAVSEKWYYKDSVSVRPYGSMYINELTPDGYRVDATGAWIRETP
ncbi:hypothetical protein [Stomatobaculum longum]|uniref:hypothetical protein n=1 Tax=Stomatobaculum longum TaxID=796942 RepID=UPI0028ED54B6|nr:hypothetical protein [Stomatobaculum longum]